MARYSKYSEGELVDYIRRAILAGKYKPREHLVEKELSDYYHVSRTPIREALRQLETMGLVVREKHKGAMVADIDLDVKVAVMGCVVNGPGEAREADIGIAGGIGEGLLIKKGQILKKLPEDELLSALRAELLAMKEAKGE